MNEIIFDLLRLGIRLELKKSEAIYNQMEITLYDDAQNKAKGSCLPMDARHISLNRIAECIKFMHLNMEWHEIANKIN